MTFDDIFAAYYALYRAEADTPLSTDDEYTVALLLAKEAIARWSAYDGTYWKELFTTLQDSAQVLPALVTTISTGVSAYDAPTDMKEAGGFVRVLSANGSTQQTYPIIEPQEVQFKSDMATYCYFTGNPNTGYVMHLNPAPTDNLNGLEFDYTYYKKPTVLVAGTDSPDMADPMFIVHRILANRFRVSRNPYYSSAKLDAEEALKVMKMDNDSGSWANPWTLPDNSGSVWGL
jgi:hypothetical protein